MNSQPKINQSTDLIDEQTVIEAIKKVAQQTKKGQFTRREAVLIWQGLLRQYFDQYPVGVAP